MSAVFFAKHLAGSLFSEQRCESGTIVIPILQMRELRPREILTYSSFTWPGRSGVNLISLLGLQAFSLPHRLSPMD